MEAFLQLFIQLISSPTGGLVYHLILVFSIVGALLSALPLFTSAFPEGRRMVFGLGSLLLFQFSLFMIAGLIWQDVIDPVKWLPFIERFLSIYSLLIIAWMWVFPSTARVGDFATLLIATLILSIGLFGAVWWSGVNGIVVFNNTWLDWVSSALALGLLCLSIVLLLIYKPLGWGYGLGMFSVLTIGFLIHAIFSSQLGSFSVAVRVSELVAYPFLFFLPQRYALPVISKSATSALENYRPNWDSVLSATDLADAYRKAAVYITQIMDVDVCWLLSPPEGEGLLVHAVYDRHLDRCLSIDTLDVRSIPLVTASLKQARPLRLPASSSAQDLVFFTGFLQVDTDASLLVVPITYDETVLMGIVCLSPYEKQTWSSNDANHLHNAALPLAQFLHQKSHMTFLANQLDTVQDSLDRSDQALNQVRQDYLQMRDQLTQARLSENDARSQLLSLAAVVAVHEQAQGTIQSLQQENQHLRQILRARDGGSLSQEESEFELRQSLRDLTLLKNTINSTDEQAQSALDFTIPAGLSASQLEMVLPLIEDMRKSIATMLEYTEFLLGDSVGELVPLQRRLIERLRLAAERLNRLVRDLIALIQVERGRADLSPAEVELSEVVNLVIQEINQQVQDKSLVLEKHLPTRLPTLVTDQLAIQRALSMLLVYACDVTPQGGEVDFTVRIEEKDGRQDFVLFQVTDAGGGIPPDDLPDFFANPGSYSYSFPSVNGSITVSLSQVRTLVDMLEGRLWVDNVPGVGATMSLLLPLTPVFLDSTPKDQEEA